MDDLLNSVGDLTDARDKDSLELTLASVMFELVGATKLNLWRVVRQQDGLRLRRRVRLDNSQSCFQEVRRLAVAGGRAQPRPTFDAPPEIADPKEERPLLESMPELYACYGAKINMRWPADADGLCRHAFPVLDGRETIGILEILRPSPLEQNQERVVLGLLRIYRNHLGMLDYSDCDELTGLLNRRRFDETFGRVSARVAGGEADAGAFISVVDIDHFKRVNDEFGHPYGDEVLVLLSRIMASLFDDAHYVFRFGGEEFVVILSGLTPQDASAQLQTLRSTVEKFSFPQVGRVTVSVGFTEIHPGDSGSSAFGRADQALYFSKRNGRNQVHSYEQLVADGELADQSRVGEEVELF